MADSTTQRLFFALWPGGREREQLETYYPLLRGCRGHKVPLQNLHITLAFLGNVGASTRDCLITKADALECPGFTLTLDELGFWRRPQVVWLGQEQTPAELLSLLAALKETLLSCGLEPENRAFRTHLTLMRKAHRAPSAGEIPSLSWAVERFVLAASETRPEGARYTILREWPLRR